MLTKSGKGLECEKKTVSFAVTERGTSSPLLSRSLIQEFCLFLTYEQVKLILAVEVEFI